MLAAVVAGKEYEKKYFWKIFCNNQSMSLIETLLHISDTSLTNCGLITYCKGRGGVKKAENNMSLESFGFLQ